jgi:hypothetical protein
LVADRRNGSIPHSEGSITFGVRRTPAGEWVLTGTFDAVLHPDGTKDFTLEHGTAENLCDTPRPVTL